MTIKTFFKWFFLSIYYFVRTIVFTAEALLTFFVLASLIFIGLWLSGYIPDSFVLENLNKLGQKLLVLYKASGI